jgi:cobalt/nickel transport system ATP-binding protein
VESAVRPILEFNEVYYKYPGRQEYALDGLSVVVPSGEKIAVIGRNGSGKSTFFQHCNGLLRPSSGTVSFNSNVLRYDRMSLARLRQHVGICFQNPDDQLFSASVAQDISFGPLNLGLAEGDARRRVHQAAQFCEIGGLLDRPTHALSGGEKARVALAGVLAMDPELLIVDELMANLDPWGRLHIFDIFRRLQENGKTLMLATHDVAVVEQWATFVVVMERGQASFAGPARELLADESLLIRTGLAEIWPRACECTPVTSTVP